MVLASCAVLAAVLANPASAGEYRLTQDCRSDGVHPALVVTQKFAQTVVVDATGRTVAGLAITGGGNLTWKGGTIEAPGGSGWNQLRGSPIFYGVRMWRNASNVLFDGVSFTNARKAIAFGGSVGLTVRNSRCAGEVEDCLSASNGSGIEFVNNQIGPFREKPSKCSLPDGSSQPLRKQDCLPRGGVWEDGWHRDVLQLRNGMSDVRAAFNVINTTGQGLTQMDSPNDAPIRNIRFHDNQIRAGRHGLTLGRCENCLIDGNRLETAVPGLKAVITPGQARACGNTVPAGGAGRDPC